MPDLPVLLLSDQESGQLLTQLRQPLSHQAQAGDDVADLVRAAQLAAAVRQMVQRADSFGGLGGDLLVQRAVLTKLCSGHRRDEVRGRRGQARRRRGGG